MPHEGVIGILAAMVWYHAVLYGGWAHNYQLGSALFFAVAASSVAGSFPGGLRVGSFGCRVVGARNVENNCRLGFRSVLRHCAVGAGRLRPLVGHAVGISASFFRR